MKAPATDKSSVNPSVGELLQFVKLNSFMRIHLIVAECLYVSQYLL